MMQQTIKNKQKVVQTTQFKKKMMNMDEVMCFVCGESRQFGKKCKNRKGKKNQQGEKFANVTIGDPSGSMYINSLPSAFFVCQSNDWSINTGVNIHVFTDISMFSSYQVA